MQELKNDALNVKMHNVDDLFDEQLLLAYSYHLLEIIDFACFILVQCS